MKTLLLMRHAKSSWKDPELQDQDRPLNKRGEKDAPRMGKLLRKESLIPDMIVSSPALRAKATAEAVAEKVSYEKEVVFLDSLYLGEPHDYIDMLQSLSDEVDTALVVGHNPGLEGLVQILSGKVVSMSTGAIACLRVPVRTWTAFSVQIDCKLDELWRPKDLG